MSQIKGCFFVISFVAQLFKTIKKKERENLILIKKKKNVWFLSTKKSEMREAKKNNIS